MPGTREDTSSEAAIDLRESEEIADLLSVIGRSFKARLRVMPGSPAAALSPPQRDVLVRIGRRPGCTAASVSDRTGRDPGQVTRLVAELVEFGLVDRTRSQEDRRSVILRLTNIGADLFTRMLERRAALSQSMLSGLTPAETQTLKIMLETMRDALIEAPGPELLLPGEVQNGRSPDR